MLQAEGQRLAEHQRREEEERTRFQEVIARQAAQLKHQQDTLEHTLPIPRSVQQAPYSLGSTKASSVQRMGAQLHHTMVELASSQQQSIVQLAERQEARQQEESAR